MRFFKRQYIVYLKTFGLQTTMETFYDMYVDIYFILVKVFSSTFLLSIIHTIANTLGAFILFVMNNRDV